nr:hypothetical protein [Candidatus Njordarchaeota archaeon]
MADSKQFEDEVRQALEKNPGWAKQIDNLLAHFIDVGQSFWSSWVAGFVVDYSRDPMKYGKRFTDLFNMKEYKEAEAKFKTMARDEFSRFDRAKQAYITTVGNDKEFNLMWRAVSLTAQDRYGKQRRRFFTHEERGDVIHDEVLDDLIEAINIALLAKIVGNNIRDETRISDFFRKATGDLAFIGVLYRSPPKIAKSFRSSWEMGKW